MILSLTTSALLIAKTAFFWFFANIEDNQEEHDKRTEDFLINDGFTKETESDPLNKSLIKVLQELKEDYRKNYYSQLSDLSFHTSAFTYNQIDRIFQFNRVQIMRLRLLIQPDTIVSINKSYNREHKYSVMRAYWVDDSGKKVLKFNVNLGNTEKVMFKNGSYDQIVISSAAKEVKLKIRGLYEETYGPMRE